MVAQWAFLSQGDEKRPKERHAQTQHKKNHLCRGGSTAIVEVAWVHTYYTTLREYINLVELTLKA